MIRSFLLFLGLFGIHTKIRLLLPGGGPVIPEIITILSCSFFILIHQPKFLKKSLFNYYLVLGFFFLSIFWGPDTLNTFIFTQKFLSFIQVFLAMILSYAIYCELKKFSDESLHRFFLYYFIFLLVGSIFEVLTPLKFVIENMKYLYPEGYYYESSIRDIQFYKFYRPKFLTMEPSYLGETFTMLNIFIRLLSKNRYKNHIFIILFLLSFITVRAPGMLATLPIIVLINLYETNFKLKFDKSSIFLLIAFPIILFVIFIFISGRLQFSVAGLDNSLIFRLIGPFYTTIDVLQKYPLFGIGLGANEIMLNEMINSFANLGLGNYVLADLVQSNHSLILKFLSYFGIFGFIILIYLLLNFLKSFGVINPSMILLIFLLLGFNNGHYGISFWTYLFIVIRAQQSQLNSV